MNALLRIWEKIVSEATAAQIQDGEKRGLVKNFLINDVYLRESAFAAKIFASEFKRTNDKKYFQKTIMAVRALENILNSINLEKGLDEPMWTPRGIKYRKGSIPATIILLYALDETCKLIDYELKFDIKKVVNYLENCYLGNGRFYHDRVDKSNKSHQYHIVNTTAMSYFFLNLAKSKGIETEFYEKEIKNIEKAIAKAQREDGFRSYIEPNIFQKVSWKFHKYLPQKIIYFYNKVLGDRSILFGDAIHHVVTLYYFMLGCNKINKKMVTIHKNMVIKGWQFISSYLKCIDENKIMFDFSWEPKPKSFRYCNFIDTSTYFYILDLMTYLLKYDVISYEEYSFYKNGLLNYIESELLQDRIPCIRPYQGGEEFLHYIMPRPSESIFDKGFLLSNLVEKEVLK